MPKDIIEITYLSPLRSLNMNFNRNQQHRQHKQKTPKEISSQNNLTSYSNSPHDNSNKNLGKKLSSSNPNSPSLNTFYVKTNTDETTRERVRRVSHRQRELTDLDFNEDFTRFTSASHKELASRKHSQSQNSSPILNRPIASTSNLMPTSNSKTKLDHRKNVLIGHGHDANTKMQRLTSEQLQNSNNFPSNSINTNSNCSYHIIKNNANDISLLPARTISHDSLSHKYLKDKENLISNLNHNQNRNLLINQESSNLNNQTINPNNLSSKRNIRDGELKN